uniref:Uncharacterized protein n=1 Tax=Diabrotica virgifera virgifera TaxID=50390 RepID=A0A6P7G1H5_DIAVI
MNNQEEYEQKENYQKYGNPFHVPAEYGNIFKCKHCLRRSYSKQTWYGGGVHCVSPNIQRPMKSYHEQNYKAEKKRPCQYYQNYKIRCTKKYHDTARFTEFKDVGISSSNLLAKGEKESLNSIKRQKMDSPSNQHLNAHGFENENTSPNKEGNSNSTTFSHNTSNFLAEEKENLNSIKYQKLDSPSNKHVNAPGFKNGNTSPNKMVNSSSTTFTCGTQINLENCLNKSQTKENEDCKKTCQTEYFVKVECRRHGSMNCFKNNNFNANLSKDENSFHETKKVLENYSNETCRNIVQSNSKTHCVNIKEPCKKIPLAITVKSRTDVKNINVNIEVSLKRKKQKQKSKQKNNNKVKDNIKIEPCPAYTKEQKQQKCMWVRSEPVSIVDIQPQRREKFSFLQFFKFGKKKNAKNSTVIVKTSMPVKEKRVSVLTKDTQEKIQKDEKNAIEKAEANNPVKKVEDLTKAELNNSAVENHKLIVDQRNQPVVNNGTGSKGKNPVQVNNTEDANHKISTSQGNSNQESKKPRKIKRSSFTYIIEKPLEHKKETEKQMFSPGQNIQRIKPSNLFTSNQKETNKVLILQNDHSKATNDKKPEELQKDQVSIGQSNRVNSLLNEIQVEDNQAFTSENDQPNTSHSTTNAVDRTTNQAASSSQTNKPDKSILTPHKSAYKKFLAEYEQSKSTKQMNNDKVLTRRDRNSESSSIKHVDSRLIYILRGVPVKGKLLIYSEHELQLFHFVSTDKCVYDTKEDIFKWLKIYTRHLLLFYQCNKYKVSVLIKICSNSYHNRCKSNKMLKLAILNNNDANKKINSILDISNFDSLQKTNDISPCRLVQVYHANLRRDIYLINNKYLKITYTDFLKHLVILVHVIYLLLIVYFTFCF